MTEALSPDQQLAVDSVPLPRRAAVTTLLMLDRRFAQIVRTTREPMVGQMRLTWWHDALIKLDKEPAPAEPLLTDLQQQVLPHGVSGERLATMIDGWEELIVSDPVDTDTLMRHAAARGAGLFAIAGTILGGQSPLLTPAGQGWALADLSRHLTDGRAVAHAQRLADDAFSRAFAASWPAKLRPLGMLGLFARLDGSDRSAVAKALTLSRFRLFGR